MRVLKEKITRKIYKYLSVDESKINNYFDFLQIQKNINNFLPERYSCIHIGHKSDIVIYDNEKNFFFDIKKDSFILKADNEIIISKDTAWLQSNFETYDPFLELIQCDDEKLEKELVKNIIAEVDSPVIDEDYQKILEVIEEFDWEESAKIFKEMKYTWGLNNSERIPTVEEIQATEIKRLVEVFFEEKYTYQKTGKYENHNTSCGRFNITAFADDDGQDFRLNLSFTPVQTLC